jgi:outer membrane protein
MKKIIFLLAIGMTIGFGVSAQSAKKTGYVNSQELLTNMPEARKADSLLAKYKKDLADQYKTMTDELTAKYAAYQKDAATMSDAVKEVKEKELNDMQNRIQDFQQGADEKIGKKNQELFKPIFDKAQAAIKTVGTEGGYDYIFEGGQLLYAKDAENILPQVKAKLGIK